MIIDNAALNRFETEVEGGTAYLEYHRGKSHIAAIHTFVPEPARKKGIAGELVKFMLEYVMQQHLKLFVYCPYVEEYVERNAVYRPLVTKFVKEEKPI